MHAVIQGTRNLNVTKTRHIRLAPPLLHKTKISKSSHKKALAFGKLCTVNYGFGTIKQQEDVFKDDHEFESTLASTLAAHYMCATLGVASLQASS